MSAVLQQKMICDSLIMRDKIEINNYGKKKVTGEYFQHSLYFLYNVSCVFHIIAGIF